MLENQLYSIGNPLLCPIIMSAKAPRMLILNFKSQLSFYGMNVLGFGSVEYANPAFYRKLCKFHVSALA